VLAPYSNNYGYAYSLHGNCKCDSLNQYFPTSVPQHNQCAANFLYLRMTLLKQSYTTSHVGACVNEYVSNFTVVFITV